MICYSTDSKKEVDTVIADRMSSNRKLVKIFARKIWKFFNTERFRLFLPFFGIHLQDSSNFVVHLT